jgi:hypothetical protein
MTNVTSLSTWLGLPPFVDATAHMDSILTKSSGGLPKVLLAQTDIQLYVARFTQALDGATEPAARIAYINMFDRDLERVRGTHHDAWADFIELSLLGAKLYLYSHSFVAGKPTLFPGKKDAHIDSSAKIILMSGLSTAMQYARCFSQLNQSVSSSFDNESSPFSTSSSNLMFYTPHYYSRTLAFTGFFLLKFLAIAQDDADSDKALAREHLAMIINYFKSFPDSKEYAGVAMTFQTLGRANLGTGSKVQTRLGASIIYDGLLNLTQLEKAKATAAQENLDTVFEDMDITISPADQEARETYLMTEFLNANWDMPWETNFFDMGGPPPGR